MVKIQVLKDHAWTEQGQQFQTQAQAEGRLQQLVGAGNGATTYGTLGDNAIDAAPYCPKCASPMIRDEKLVNLPLVEADGVQYKPLVYRCTAKKCDGSATVHHHQ